MTHRGWARWASSGIFPLVTTLLLGERAFGQRLLWDSAGALPGNLAYVEYENLKALREMPDFPSLRRACTGNSLRGLEGWLQAFGVKEENVVELVVGLEEGKDGFQIFAVASGQFNPALASEGSSSDPRFVPTEIGDVTGYCSARASERPPCAVLRGQNWAALGAREFLSYVVGGGDGLTEPLSSEPEFMDLAAMVPKDAPLWGFARGVAAVQWFKQNIPFADSVPIVWSSTLKGLDGLTYSVMPDEHQVHVTVNLQYKTSSGASFLGMVLEGVKAIEGLLWHGQHPAETNPFSDAQVDVDDRSVSLALSVSYETLESGLPWALARGR
jgi:hypothetical protein